MTRGLTQLRALVWLRWTMIRTPGVRVALCLSGVLVIYLLETAMTSAALLAQPALAASVELAPAAFLGFGVLAVIAPLTAGGGTEMVPSSQLVAYPVRPSTLFLGGLLLAPVNLVWVVQLLVLAAETAYLTIDGSSLAGGLTTLAFVVFMTVAGQAVAWCVVGLRQSHTGRLVVGVVAATVAIAAVLVVRLGYAVHALRLSPTHSVVSAIQAGPGLRWIITTAALTVGAGLGLYAGSHVCAWALRRPDESAAMTAGRQLRRRSARDSALRELVAVDRASVWRASALRRGGIVLAFLPGVAALGASIPWGSLIVLPGLVAAGAGLLFGINAFCLDGSGALWLASLPHDPMLMARSKLLVLTETTVAAMLLAMFTGSLRSPGSPTSTQVIAMAASCAACAALVIATCMALSVRRPHRADLRTPRDAVAPPGALTAASARLAFPAGLVGLLLEGSAETDAWWAPPLTALPIIVVSLLWLRRSMTRYGDAHVRSRIVQTVSAG